jgi:hypothetical protein
LNALHSILKNPAYAGAFAYGRRIADPARQIPGRPATGRLRQPRSRWLALVKDVYPAYITWEEYEQIQATIEENRQKMAERLTRKQAIRNGAALLTGLVRCGFCGHAMQVAYKDGRFQYICGSARYHYGKSACQYLSGVPIDEAVVQEFFRVLQPAEIDALESVSNRQAEHQQELVRHLEQEVKRLEYAAKRAERQYDSVDPENRLIAATLEKKWEDALAEWEQAKGRLAEAKGKTPPPVKISPALREAFADAGRRLPEIWPHLSLEAKKQLLRTLVTGVNLQRDATGLLQIRIVWQGGLVSEKSVHMAVSTRRHTEIEQMIIGRIEKLAEEGFRDHEIAERLNAEGYFPCRSATFTPQVVAKLCTRHGIRLGLGRVRGGDLLTGYTVKELARIIGAHETWIYRGIHKGRIQVERDAHWRCYLFPRTQATVDRLKRLKEGKVRQVSFPKEHCDG